ncbi:TrbG/VirB9 family P-type conjugative transfer protein [Paraburkholderia dipogonis]|uniref:TrbG/VirB9 family P-type conjugative transfer protein n=1 Tax=Paraburkholderia dipogonis TaxID=1211383 RepID=UPI001FCCB1E4|nr:TrbG/VirB9 family P-type conjugative transfer protein [Paraburkholderia dipogonis]
MDDTVQCEVDDDKMNHVFIKPHKADIVNALHLTTNRSEYNFTLIALPAGVRFQHPRADGPGAPDRLNWDYSVDGSAEFKPEVMFYDGHSIWMRMPAKAQTWPVPMYKDHGDRVVGHFIRRAYFVIFRRLADKIVLVSGKDEVTVVRGRRRMFGVF